MSGTGPRSLCAVLVAAALGGCGSRAPASTRRFHVGDTLVVQSAGPRIADTLIPVETRRYGRADGPVDYLLDRVFSFAVDDDGSVFVQDRSGGIREFARDGSFVRYPARKGKGPGEVEYATSMDAKGAGELAVVDIGNVRISVLGGESSPWSARMPRGFPAYREGGIRFHRDGTLWIAVNPPYPESGGIPFPRPVYVRVRDDGAFVDTIFAPAGAAAKCPTLSDFQHRAGFWEDQREPFVPKVQWALGPGGTFVVGCPNSYSFVVHGPDGSITRVERAWTPVVVSEEERRFREAMPVPRSGTRLPAYARIDVPGDGRIWVWPRQADEKVPLEPEVAKRFGVTHTWSISSHGAFDVFGRDGTWLAVVRLPSEARYSGFSTEPNVVIRGDTLWAVAQDAMDVEYIVRYQVPGLEGASGP